MSIWGNLTSQGWSLGASSDAHSALQNKGCRPLARNCSDGTSESLGQENGPRRDMRMTGFIVTGFRCGPTSPVCLLRNLHEARSRDDLWLIRLSPGCVVASEHHRKTSPTTPLGRLRDELDTPLTSQHRRKGQPEKTKNKIIVLVHSAAVAPARDSGPEGSENVHSGVNQIPPKHTIFLQLPVFEESLPTCSAHSTGCKGTSYTRTSPDNARICV